MTAAAASERPRLRLLVFAALAAFAAVPWARLLSDPEAPRALLAATAVTGGAAALVLLGRGRRRVAAWGLVVVVSVLVLALALLATGVPARMLAPTHWGELIDRLGDGFDRLANADFPYEGRSDWSRIVILLGLPLALWLAAVVAFWPSRSGGARRPILALAVIVTCYGIAATNNPPRYPLLEGLVLFVLVSAWLWLPRLERRQAPAAAALVVAFGLLAVPLSGPLDAEEPWLDYENWSWPGAGDERSESFNWEHTYGPIDWPRNGATVLEVRSAQPHYWRAAVLDQFDVTRWEMSAGIADQQLELPTRVEPGRFQILGHQEWKRRSTIRIESLSSRYLVAPGTVLLATGLSGDQTSAGILLRGSDTLSPGDQYTVITYSPDPTTDDLRASRGRYPPALEHFTRMWVPIGPGGTIRDLTVPLRDGAQQPAIGWLERSPYGGVYRLARRLTADAASPYAAVHAIESHLLGGAYRYDETPPRRQFPLAAFLQRDRVGYCQQFSGAMALMLRMVGIPSRVASGFSPGIRSPDGFVVVDFDAHSWVEVYFRGIGWVPFDPTPAASPASSRVPAPGGALATRFRPSAQGDLRGHAPRPAIAATPRGGTAGGGGASPWLGLVPLALIGIPATLLAVRIRRRRALSAAALAEAQLDELRNALRRRRGALKPGTTLRQLEKRMRVSRQPAVADYAARLSAIRYGPSPPAPPSGADRRRVRRQLGAGGGLLGRARILAAFPPGGPFA